MQGMTFGFVSWLGLTLLLGGCSAPRQDQSIEIKVSQDWQLQAGDKIANYAVTGGLGDISIELGGGLSSGELLNWGSKPIYAPFNGEVRIDKRKCLYYTAGEVPAYMFRLCGLNSPHLGKIQAAQPIAHGTSLQFATLRKQPNGKWAIVEPDKTFIEKLLKAP